MYATAESKQKLDSCSSEPMVSTTTNHTMKEFLISILVRTGVHTSVGFYDMVGVASDSTMQDLL